MFKVYIWILQTITSQTTILSLTCERLFDLTHENLNGKETQSPTGYAGPVISYRFKRNWLPGLKDSLIELGSFLEQTGHIRPRLRWAKSF